MQGKDFIKEDMIYMESLGLKNLALISPIWVDADTRTASLQEQITSYEREIRLNTFGDGDPNYSD